MKIRVSFVSNSSSSSFILRTQKDVEIFKNIFNNTPIFNVGELRQQLKKILEEYKVLKKMFNDNFYFLEENLNYDTFNISDLLHELDGILDDAYITEAIDRDIAYQLGYNKEVFMGDL